MKNKIAKIKEFVHTHNNAYFWTCGLITGIGATFVYMYNPQATEILRITREQIEAMYNDADSAVLFDLPNSTALVICNN
jgi:hypothetical protein